MFTITKQIQCYHFGDWSTLIPSGKNPNNNSQSSWSIHLQHPFHSSHWANVQPHNGNLYKNKIYHKDTDLYNTATIKSFLQWITSIWPRVRSKYGTWKAFLVSIVCLNYRQINHIEITQGLLFHSWGGDGFLIRLHYSI